jgi:hypothetical protein
MDANSKANEQSQSSTGISRATNMAWSDATGQASIESRQHHHAEMDRNAQIASEQVRTRYHHIYRESEGNRFPIFKA